jgi:hypothetical protein
VQALASCQGPDLVLVKEQPTARGAHVHFDVPKERVTLFFVKRGPVLGAFARISNLASHRLRKDGGRKRLSPRIGSFRWTHVSLTFRAIGATV